MSETELCSPSLKIVPLLDVVRYTAGTTAADVWERMLGAHHSRGPSFTSS